MDEHTVRILWAVVCRLLHTRCGAPCRAGIHRELKVEMLKGVRNKEHAQRGLELALGDTANTK